MSKKLWPYGTPLYDPSNVAITGGTISGVTMTENFTTSTDPATNAAVSTTIVNTYNGVIVTLTGAGNTQTLQNPTTAATIRKFLVINNDTSTHNLPVVANSVTFTLTPGEGQCFIWDGTAWGPIDLGITEIPVKVVQGGTGALTLTDHGVLVGSGTSAITALTVGTNGQVLVGSTGADPVFATITDGEGITTTAGAGTLTIACEDASESNKGVTVYSGTTKALAGTDTASAMTPADVKTVLDARTLKEEIEPATDNISADQCRGSIINNYEQADNVVLTLPAIAAGMHFTVILGTTVAKYFRIAPNTSDSIYLDGVTTGDGKYVGVASAAAGNAIQFVAFQTGASAWDWFAATVSGAWVAEA